MLGHRPTAWLRFVAGIFSLAGLLALSGCGGGNGAPNNPYAPGPAIPAPLTVLPSVATAYSKTPTTLTVTGGVGPYYAFSSNSAVLPVTQVVSGNTILLVANDVADNTTVTITVQDSAGTVGTGTVTVVPAPLLPNLVTVTPNNDCTGSPQNLGGALCSGGTGTASVRLAGPGGGPLPNRAVRFDVVSGSFAIQSSNPATPLVSTLTVVTDANGTAVVGIAIPVNAPTQLAVIRATDVTTGNHVDGQFTISQVTDGSAVLSVVPASISITGPLKDVCSTGVQVSYYIFGGTPPYTIGFPIPQGITLLNSIVTTSGGHFDAITNGSCLDSIPFAVTDATGRTIPDASAPRLTNAPGTATPPAPTPAPNLAVAPGSITATGCAGKTFQFTITGGTPPYSGAIALNPSVSPAPVLSPNPVGVSGGILSVAFGATPVPAGTTGTVSITDSTTPTQKTATATITCN